MNPPAKPKKTLFLTNKELLAEIHRCKKSYCSFTDERYADFDGIVRDLAEVTDDFLDEVCAAKSKKLTPKKSPPVVVDRDGLIIRVMTWEHIPLATDKKKKSRQTNQTHEDVPFPPFKHYKVEYLEGARTLVEVGRSHWVGSFDNGHFDAHCGKVTNRMGAMYKLLVERMARKSNWRGYTYVDEMQSNALVQLCYAGLQFDESKSSNPFAFYSTTMTHCFTRVFNTEKKVQNTRDDLLIAMGAAPSYTRQIANEMAMNGSIEPTKLPAKRGRKPHSQKTQNSHEE